MVEGGVMDDDEEGVVFTKFMGVIGGDGLLRCGEKSLLPWLIIGLALLPLGLQTRISGLEPELYMALWMLWQLLPLLEVRGGGGAARGSRSR